MDNNLLKLKTNLTDALEKWMQEKALESQWISINTYICDETAQLMSDAAFNILLAQKGLSEYLRKENTEP